MNATVRLVVTLLISSPMLVSRAANAGLPLEANCNVGTTVAATSMYYGDANGNGIWNGTRADWAARVNVQAGPGTPFIGDWNGDGWDDPGKLVGTTYSLDLNGNGVWNANAGGDRVASFATSFGPGAPLVGDWNGDFDDEIGTYIATATQSRFYLDINGNGVWNGNAGGDQLAYFDSRVPVGGEPVIGDWDGDGNDEIGKYVGTSFYRDLNGNGVWNGNDGGDYGAPFAMEFGPGVPLVGDWDGDGDDEVGVYIPTSGKFLLDRNGNQQWDGAPGDLDVAFAVFAGQGTPLICDWNEDGDDDLGLVVATRYFVDRNGNLSWNGILGGDRNQNFSVPGGTGRKPAAGVWRPH